MAGFGSPCGACKFLRRKCVRGCVFAPYFCHEQGAAHFAAIHKVFGASNVSKLLTHLPVSDRSEAALTISYEAQARLQDPIYGCVSQIFALQQQIVTLQAQLASLRAQTAQGFANAYSSANSSTGEDKLSNNLPHYEFEDGYFLPREVRMAQNSVSDTSMNPEVMLYNDNGFLDSNSFLSSQHYDQHSYTNGNQFSFITDESSSCAMASLDLQVNTRRSAYHDMEDLQSVAFGHLNCA
ncbi:LOB domain-containing protein CRL1-like [Canna indica]|uniref:LOB domain-containing protein CRL1-like n=1 Tax=Canna indica TaxID=4628 RepID=A0AAQ3KUF4_9LILI|nr:LOB domain-containing protein CRL1-like [Canna indica]